MIRVVVGPPCAGKTTFVSENAGPGDTVLDWDVLVDAVDADPDAVGQWGLERSPEARALATFMRAVAVSRSLEQAGASETTAWIIHGRPSERDLERYVLAGATIDLLDPGETECLERAEADGRPAESVAEIRRWYDDPPNIADAWLGDSRKGSPMRTKTVAFDVKATGPDAEPGLAEGEFIAYASTFDRDPDAYGDIIAPGAFAKTLEEWEEKGAPIPLFFGHRLDDPDFNIGEILEAKEDAVGLVVTGRIDMESPKGPQVYRLLKAGRLRELSFSYTVRDSAVVDLDPTSEAAGQANELRDVDLLEVSLVQVGANRHTSVLAVKAAADLAAKAAGDFTPAERDTIADAAEELRETAAKLERLLAPSDGDETSEPAREDGPASGQPEDAADAETEAAEASVTTAKAAMSRLKLALALNR